MRKVLFKKWIPAEYIKYLSNSSLVKGTNQLDNDFIHKGLFHCWGCEWEEFETNVGNNTVGIIELEDGTIETVIPQNIKFVEPINK